MKALKIVVLSILTISFIACSATPTRRSFSENWRDSITTSKIKWKMGRDKVVKAHNIDVDTWRGVVTMTGRVTSEEEKARAEQIAKNAKNVKEVKNYLEIVGPDSVPQKVAKETKPFSKPTGKHNLIAAKPTKASSTKEEPINLKEEDLANENMSKETPVAEKTHPKKHENGVSHEIKKELAATGDNYNNEDVTLQAEKELKELKSKKAVKKSPQD